MAARHSASSRLASQNEVSPGVSSGLQRTFLPVIVPGWIVLTALYLVSLNFHEGIAKWLNLPSPAESFCKESREGTVCARADLFSFQVSSGMALTFCGVYGFYLWHVSKAVHTVIPKTPAGRLFGHMPQAELLIAVNFMFQSWDFVVSATIPEHATPIFLGHHVLASTVSFCSLNYQVLQYYGVYFLGLTEVSSIALVFLDLGKFFPPAKDSALEMFILFVCGPAFVVSFIYYRVIRWWPVSYQLFTDIRFVLKSGQAKQLRGSRATWVLLLFLACNLPLGLLQLYWTTIIADEVHGTLVSIVA
jgi:TLC domain